MTVIVELTIPSDEFELGRILQVESSIHVTLDTMVPLGGKPTPFVRIQNGARDSFEQSVQSHPSVSDIQLVDSEGEETLYALDWDPSEGSLLETALDMDAALLGASGTADQWQLEFRFPSHDVLSAFQEYYLDADISVTIERIYNPTKPDAGPWYGLTATQRETLTDAVEDGYYALPRKVSTQELADGFGVSDQAVTERLRRGITTLVDNTLLAVEDES
jgi:predicted DNA binding protein